MKKITLDTKCKIIGDNAFIGWENLSEINLENVRRIGRYTFFTTALQEINLKHIEQMGSSAFSRCEKLKSVQLGTYLTKINKETFKGCSSLSEINLGKIKKIGEKAFNGCSSLEKVDLESVETLEQDAFKDCTSLNKVVLPNENAAKIKEDIISQTGKSAGDGENKTIQFINDPDVIKKQ